MADVLARQRAAEAAQEAAILARRSQAIQLALPRPLSVVPFTTSGAATAAVAPRPVWGTAAPGSDAAAEFAAAAAAVRAEMGRLLAQDAREHPVVGAGRPPNAANAWETFDDQALQQARAALQQEWAAMQAMAPELTVPVAARAGFGTAWTTLTDELLFTGGAAGRWVRRGDASAEQRVSFLKAEFQHVVDMVHAQRAANHKAEVKLATLMGGYVARATKARAAAASKWTAAHEVSVQAESFARLYTLENEAVPRRMEVW